MGATCVGPGLPVLVLFLVALRYVVLVSQRESMSRSWQVKQLIGTGSYGSVCEVRAAS